VGRGGGKERQADGRRAFGELPCVWFFVFVVFVVFIVYIVHVY